MIALDSSFLIAFKVANDAHHEKAAALMRELVRSPQFIEFLTLPAYQRVLKEETF